LKEFPKRFVAADEQTSPEKQNQGERHLCDDERFAELARAATQAARILLKDESGIFAAA